MRSPVLVRDDFPWSQPTQEKCVSFVENFRFVPWFFYWKRGPSISSVSTAYLQRLLALNVRLFIAFKKHNVDIQQLPALSKTKQPNYFFTNFNNYYPNNLKSKQKLAIALIDGLLKRTPLPHVQRVILTTAIYHDRDYISITKIIFSTKTRRI